MIQMILRACCAISRTRDFIQLGAELGIIGFSLYLGIFLMAIVCLQINTYSNFELTINYFFFLLTGLGAIVLMQILTFQEFVLG